MRYQFQVVNGSTPKSSEPENWDGDIPWVTPDDLGKTNSRVIKAPARYITSRGYESCGTQMVGAGSLILSTRAPIGHIAISGTRVCTNQGCRSLIFRHRCDETYFYFLFRAAKPVLEAAGRGSTFTEIAGPDLKSVALPIPPLKEQRAIAKFLDRQTARIDALVARKERLIELLQEKRTALITRAVTRGLDPNVPMKDSGVEWLGEIPANWDIAPVYTRYEVALGKMLDSKQVTGDSLGKYLRNVDVQWDAVQVADLPEMDFSQSDRYRYLLRPGDLLVCEGGEVGRTAIWRGELNECFYQKAIHRVRTRSDSEIPRFFYFLMYALAQRGVFTAGGNPNTIDHPTAVQLRHYRMPFPSSHEQREIAGFLDRETARIDDLVSKVYEAIDHLNEFRNALISAAVTGKIEVREEAL